MDNGVQKGDRTGTGTISTFGYQMRFNLCDSIIPVLTTKRMHLRSILHEIIWYMAGDTNIKYLNDNGVRIWNEWADKNGDLGPVYGAMWRNWGAKTMLVMKDDMSGYEEMPVGGIDQIADALHQIKTNPNSRRIIVTGWDPRTVPDSSLSFDENVANGKQALPPCHMVFQFYVADGKLSCMLYQRSCDVGLGVPFNIAQYSIMTLMMARCAGLEPGEFIWTGGDCHIYNNHIEQLKEQLTRKPFRSPHIVLPYGRSNMEDFTFDDIDGIVGYDSYDAIKMEVSV
jgi:thymidylate synthase